MLAVQFDSFGDPAKVLAVQDAARPEPGPGEVLVRMTARPINPSDLLTVRGKYAVRPALPATPGYEGIGIVEALGEGVGAPPLGSRVLPIGAGQGTWQEYVTAAAATCVPVPDAIDDETGCQLFINPVTAWAMVVEELSLGAGRTLMANACGSAVGRVVAQLAPILGFRLIAVTRSDAYTEELTALGATAVINTASEALVPAVMRMTGGRRAAAALDAVGGESGTELAHCLAPGGRMLVYGLLSGEPLSLSGAELVFRTLTVSGFWLKHWLETVPAGTRDAAFAQVIGHVAAGRIRLPVAARYDLDQAAEAAQAAVSSGRQGKVILTG